ncbi:MAG: outer membrane lipoprotein-sorting protein [Candidatus Korobacteraceae bacterium]|jgi:outer membrane lipoprotein-sorting protein
MKKLMLMVSLAALLAASAFAQSKQGNLEEVLNLLDKTSASFKSVQTDFVWDQYQKVVDEHDIQKGVMYFKRSGSNVDVAADILQPEHKKLVFANGKVQVYSFKTRHVDEKEAGQNREEFESFLALGFGGRGHDLLKNFDVRYAGEETVDGVAAYKLELTPKSQKVRNMFRLFTLWIDPKTGMSVQQKALEGEYDFRLAKYSSMKLNQKLPEDAFKLKAN